MPIQFKVTNEELLEFWKCKDSVAGIVKREYPDVANATYIRHHLAGDLATGVHRDNDLVLALLTWLWKREKEPRRIGPTDPCAEDWEISDPSDGVAFAFLG